MVSLVINSGGDMARHAICGEPGTAVLLVALTGFLRGIIPFKDEELANPERRGNRSLVEVAFSATEV